MISGVQVKLSHHRRRNPVRRKQQVTSLPISFLPGKQGSRQLDAMLRLTSGGAETHYFRGGSAVCGRPSATWQMEALCI